MKYSVEYSMEYSMEYENPKNGIFRKNMSTTLNLMFLEYGIFQEYSKNKTQQRYLIFFGIWNIPRIFQKINTTRIFDWNIFHFFHTTTLFLLLMEYGIFQFFSSTTFFPDFLNMEYSKINQQQQK